MSVTTFLTRDAAESNKISDFGYRELNHSIKETFIAIGQYEWQASNKLRLMRDGHYIEGGYNSFEIYCETELVQYGGYRRVRDLLAAKKVVDTLPDELKPKITKISQTRPLYKLVNSPEKLHEAVAIASQEKTYPTAADFARAVEQVAPRNSVSNNYTRKPEKENTQLCQPEAEITYPAAYSEAIAALKEQHRQELERLEQDLRVGLKAEARNEVEQDIKQEFEAFQKLLQQQKDENIRLQQRLDEMEGLRQLEVENQQLKQRIEELEFSVQQASSNQWENTFSKKESGVRSQESGGEREKSGRGKWKQGGSRRQGEKEEIREDKLRMNISLSPDSWLLTPDSFPIDLRLLAVEPPLENKSECLWLMSMALGNLADTPQTIKAAAVMLGVEARKEDISLRVTQLRQLPEAISSIREVLAKPNCTWDEFWAVAQNYRPIEKEYRNELSDREIKLIEDLKNYVDDIRVGSIVAHANLYSKFYPSRGEVTEDFGEDVMVAWEDWKHESRKQARYSKTELRLV